MAMTGGTAVLVHTGYGGGRSDFPIRVYVYYKTSQSVTNNQSDITCGMYVTTPGSNWDIGAWGDTKGSYIGTSALTFDGSIPNFAGTRWLAENKTFKVNHNSDGTGKATIYWKWGVNSSWAGIQNISGSFEITLPTIPRAGSIDSLVCSTSYLDGVFTYKYTPKSNVFYNRLRVSIPNVVVLQTINLGAKPASQQTGTYTLTTALLESIYNRYPNASTCVIGFVVETYSDSGYTSKVGESQELTLTQTFPAGVAPAIGGISWTKSSNEPSTWPMTQGISKGTMTMTGVKGSYGSTIVSYSLTFAGLSSTTASLSVNNIADPGKLKAVARVVDSRGRPADKEIEFTVAEYTKPQLTVSAFRSNASGAEDPGGEYLCVKATVGITAVGDNAIQSVTLQYKQRTASYYTSVSLTSGVNKVVAASSNYTWDWVVSASDKVSSVSINGSIATGAVVLDILANGKGIALGKVSEKEGFDSAWAFMHNGVTQVDYVVGQGTDGSWAYCKYNSGLSLAWTTQELSFTATPNAIMGGYYTSSTIGLPGDSFTQPPTCFAQGRIGTGLGFVSVSSVSNTSVSVGVFGNQNSTTSYVTSIFAIGRWK